MRKMTANIYFNLNGVIIIDWFSELQIIIKIKKYFEIIITNAIDVNKFNDLQLNCNARSC